MLQFSHDPEVNTLYTYFTDLEAGQAVESLEYPAHLLLDAEGLVVGLRLDLDDDVTLAQLELVLDGEFGRLDMETGYVRILIPGAESNRYERLEQTAILDLDADEQILGVELALPQGFDAQRLARLAPLMVALDEVPQAGEGPVVFGVEVEEAELDEPDEAVEIVPPPTLRSGFVALVGKPNVGKSTLLNMLLGQKVTIVSPRAQTTRVPVRGILSRPDAQVVFIDTPGIHQPSHKLGKFMVELAERTLPNADVICFMVDISQPPSQLDRSIAEQVQRARAHKLLVLNKVDIRPRRGTTYMEEYRDLGQWDMELAISAQRGQGLSNLLDEIVARLPVGQPLYPTEQVTDQSEQQLAAELVREKVLFFIQQEVPHAVAVEVDEWETKEQAIYIRMTINVEKESQKGILIGAGGAMLKRIGSSARRDIERMVGQKVFLELWVKVRANWRDDLSAMGWLGYRMKDWR